MKKIFALLLALVMCFSLLACGDEEENPSDGPSDGVIEPPASDKEGGIDLPIIPAA